MNPIVNQNSTWYKFVEEVAEKNDLHIVNLGFVPDQGVYWDIPYEQNLINTISSKEAAKLFADDLATITPSKIIVIDFIAKRIISSSIDFLEEISPAIPYTIQTRWLYIESQLIPCAMEIFIAHLNNPSLNDPADPSDT